MDEMNGMISFVLLLAIALFAFFLFRAVVLWYWKIDKIVSLLEELVTINRTALKLSQEPEPSPTDTQAAVLAALASGKPEPLPNASPTLVTPASLSLPPPS